jgi:hypothetical protein
MEMGTETLKEDLMIIMVNSLVADHSLIDINNRENPLLDIIAVDRKRSVNNEYQYDNCDIALVAQLGRALSWYGKDRWFKSSPGLFK